MSHQLPEEGQDLGIEGVEQAQALLEFPVALDGRPDGGEVGLAHDLTAAPPTLGRHENRLRVSGPLGAVAGGFPASAFHVVETADDQRGGLRELSDDLRPLGLDLAEAADQALS